MKFKMDGGLLLDIVKAAKATNNDEGLITAKDDRWVMKSMGPDGIIMFAVRVTEEGMEEFGTTDFKKIGINFETLEDAIWSSKSPVTAEAITSPGGSHKLMVENDGYEAGVTMVAEEFIEGVATKAPDLDWAVEVEGDISFLSEYAKRASKLIESSFFYIGARPEGIILYTEEDNEDLRKEYSWEEFDDHSIDWSVGDYEYDNTLNPPEDKGVDTIVDLNRVKSMNFIEDEGRLYLDNHTPLRLLFDTKEGVATSYFVSPRILSDNMGMATIPEKE